MYMLQEKKQKSKEVLFPLGSERNGCSVTCQKLYIKIMAAPETGMHFLAHSMVQAASHQTY